MLCRLQWGGTTFDSILPRLVSVENRVTLGWEIKLKWENMLGWVNINVVCSQGVLDLTAQRAGGSYGQGSLCTASSGVPIVLLSGSGSLSESYL